jgi:hypothetical protein
MNTLMICVAAAALGIDVGWQRLPEGGVEYIIQLDPQTLEVLRAGEPIQSDIPPSAGEVRSYRIVVGTQKLPRDEAPAEPPVTQKPPVTQTPLTPQKNPEPRTADPKESPLGTTQATSSNSAGKHFPEQTAFFEQPKDAPAVDKPSAKAAIEDETGKPVKPWLPLTFTLLGLVASLSANVYLGWIVAELRQRWRTMQQVQTAGDGR